VSPDEPPGWADRLAWLPNRRTRNVEECLSDFEVLGNYDRWIAGYVTYLNREHDRLSGGAISEHYLKCLNAVYLEFLHSGSQRDRLRTWIAVHTLCQWLCQLYENRGAS
jgi:hypothetical protein